jgi:glycosyltransferase involved in cell wall biosynthesis
VPATGAGKKKGRPQVSNKKIILIFSSLKNGGGRTFAISIAKQLKQNCDIYLSTLRDPKEAIELADELGVQFISIFNPKVLLNPRFLVVSNSQITSLLCTLLFPFRHIYITHGFANGLGFMSLIRRVLWVIQINIPGTKLVGCGQAEFNKIRSLTNRFVKCYLIKNSVPPDIFLSKLEVKPFNKSSHNIRLCYIGRICYQKGLDVLIDALANCSIQFELTVIGDFQTSETDFCKNIQEKIAESKGQIKIVGAQKITIELLNQFDLCISPSRFEGLPYLLLELAYYGMPLMVSDCPGNSDVIPNEELGFIFSSDDSQSLNKSLNRLSATTNEDINKRAASLRGQLIEKYNPKDFGNEYEHLFNA